MNAQDEELLMMTINEMVDLPPEVEAELLTSPSRSSDLITAEDRNTAISCTPSHKENPVSVKDTPIDIPSPPMNAGTKNSCLPMIGCLSTHKLTPLRPSELTRTKTRPLLLTRRPTLTRMPSTHNVLPKRKTPSTTALTMSPFIPASSLISPLSSTSHTHITSRISPYQTTSATITTPQIIDSTPTKTTSIPIKTTSTLTIATHSSITMYKDTTASYNHHMKQRDNLAQLRKLQTLPTGLTIDRKCGYILTPRHEQQWQQELQDCGDKLQDILIDYHNDQATRLNEIRTELEHDIKCPYITNKITALLTHGTKHNKRPATINRPPHMHKKIKPSKNPSPSLRSDRKQRHLPPGREKPRRHKHVNSPIHTQQPPPCSLMSIDLTGYKPPPS